MGITGNLKTMELAELLQWLSGAAKTGTLVVENGKIQKQIYFKDGRVISSASTDPSEYLGAFLVSHGFISEMELRQAVKMQESNKMLLGKILTTIGALSERDVHRMLKLKAEEGIYDVFTWTEGAFRFLDDRLPTSTMVPISIDVAALVLEGMQRLDEWRRIREVIPTVQHIPVATGPWDESVMTEGARQILANVDDDRTVAEICKTSHASEFHVCRILCRQTEARRMKIVRSRAGKGSSPAPETDEPAGSGPGPAITADRLLEASRRLLEEGDLDAALRHVRAGRALEPENKKVETVGAQLETRIREQVERSGVRLDAVPVLARRMEELTKVQLTPHEGFLLTRIDGVSNVQSIARLTPVSSLETQLIFWRLHRAGHVVLQPRN